MPGIPAKSRVMATAMLLRFASRAGDTQEEDEEDEEDGMVMQGMRNPGEGDGRE
ncbi:hypothetical protein [Noviherbaspirillum aerium]|uniref:hypothetical protein n=1 Tax=Noviherbaspirillum aerium TaxID=2588497 RepID=UPI00178C5600|nr:hypothetical protein [Noviherbaspirillum aerium]